MRKLVLILITVFVVVFIFAKCSEDDGRDHAFARIEPAVFIPSTTTTTTVPPPPPTTATTARAQKQATSRGSTRSSFTPSGDINSPFWQYMRNCESPTNGGTRYRGYYQFAPDTWKSVGGSGDPANASMVEQHSRAVQLSKKSNPYQQWPTCWRRAVAAHGNP